MNDFFVLNFCISDNKSCLEIQFCLAPGYLNILWGCVSERGSPIIFNIPGITPAWNAFTWSSRWDQLIWIKKRPLVWHGTVSWPLLKDYSIHMEVLTISKVLHGFKISPILADLCHIYSHNKDFYLKNRPNEDKNLNRYYSTKVDKGVGGYQNWI